MRTFIRQPAIRSKNGFGKLVTAKDLGDYEALMDAESISDDLGMHEEFFTLAREDASAHRLTAERAYPILCLRAIEHKFHVEFASLLPDPLPVLRTEAFILADLLKHSKPRPSWTRAVTRSTASTGIANC